MKSADLRYAGAEHKVAKCGQRIGVDTTYFSERDLNDFCDHYKLNQKNPVMGSFVLCDLEGTSQQNDAALDELRNHAHINVASHVFTDDNGINPLLPSDRIYVKVKKKYSAERLLSLLKQHHLNIYSHISPTELLVSTTNFSSNPVKTARSLLRSKYIKLAQPDFLMPVTYSALVLPSDQYFSQQWYLDHNNTLNGNGIGIGASSHANVVNAWHHARSSGNSAATIAIVDAGFDVQHPDLDPNTWVSPYNSELDNSDVRPSFPQNLEFLSSGSIARSLPSLWHGTACAGIALARANGRGVVGAAPNARFMPIKKSTTITSGVELDRIFTHARLKGAGVVSCSWEVGSERFITQNALRSIRDCARFGRNGKGTIILFSAGNENTEISGLANAAGVHAIGATNSNGEKQLKSKFGHNLWVCAPAGDPSGAGALRTMHTTDFSGVYEHVDGKRPRGYTVGDYTTEFGQTSGATALVAGICGFLMSLWPELDAKIVMDAISETAVPVASHSQIDHNGRNDKVGHGKVDALEAAKYLQQRFPR